ncbi:TetR/AcrR family transcriptional regulator [Streptomyces sp. NPDC060243]|uniref:TetR/AcrR family transcriptional regulator n=1 Tax=Streptomyces sp. NPDC060243 TaxID=3347081 RepID=UPI00365A0080
MGRVGLSTRRLVRAGAELADEEGFAQVTLSALARRFGVKPASLYAHVRSSDDLRTGIALLALDELADRAADALAGRAGKDALSAFAEAYRSYAREHPGRYAATRHPLDHETALASAGPRHARMSRALLRGYALDEPDATHAVRLLGSVFHGFVDLELSGNFAHSAPPAEESWHRTLDALDHLLRTWPPAPATASVPGPDDPAPTTTPAPGPDSPAPATT